jgi:hypothetical protein
MAQADSAAASPGGSIDVAKLQRIEQLVRGMQQPEPGERCLALPGLHGSCH